MKKDLIKNAVEFLGAVESDGRFVYFADETRSHYAVTQDEAALLGRMLVERPRSTAYSEWCALVTSCPVASPWAREGLT
jgi:hypothetical protein